MGFLKKLLPIAGAAVGMAFGMPQVGAALGSAAAGALGSGAQKGQAGKTIADYGAAETGSINAFTGARDASVAGYQPFLSGGQSQFAAAQNMLSPGYDYAASSPGYQFLVDEMQNATTRGAAAGHQLGSGGFYKALQRNAAGLASQEFGNDFNRRNQLAQMGLQAAGGNALAQSGYARGIQDTLFGAADGRSGARINKGNAIQDQYTAMGNLGTTLFGSGGLFGGGGGNSAVNTFANDWESAGGVFDTFGGF